MSRTNRASSRISSSFFDLRNPFLPSGIGEILVSRCREVVFDIDLSSGDTSCSSDEVNFGTCDSSESERVGIVGVDCVFHTRLVLPVEDDSTSCK